MMQDTFLWNPNQHRNTAWDIFGNGDDHTVPCRHTEEVNEYVLPIDNYNKPQHEDNVGTNVDRRGSASKTSLREEGETYACQPMKNETSSIFEQSQFKVYEDCKQLYSNNPILGSVFSTAGIDSCYLSFDGICQSARDVGYVESGNKGRENDLFASDFPDVSNFEDIDRVFRNCNPTFGQGITSNADEMLWTSSSSNTIYGSEVTLESGMGSSFPELVPLNNALALQDADNNFMTKSDKPAAVYDESSSLFYQYFVNRSDNTDKDNCVSVEREQVNEKRKRVEISALTRIDGEDVLVAHGNPDMISSRKNQKQKEIVGTSSSYIPISNQVYCPPPSVMFERNPSSSYTLSNNVIDQVPQHLERAPDKVYNPTTGTTEKLETLHMHQLVTPMIVEDRNQPASLVSNSSVQRRCCSYQHEAVATNNLESIRLESASEIDSSVVQENSCMASVCPDTFSVEATSFQQFQDVTDQLDIGIKLCIRDSLYRLARSADERRHFMSLNNFNRVNNGARGVHFTESTEQCLGFMEAESVTNSIDRSIAHLLFAGIPDPTCSI